MKQKIKERKVTNTMPIPQFIQKGTSNEDYAKNFEVLKNYILNPSVNPSIVFNVQNNDDSLEALITSQTYINHVNKTREDFILNKDNLKKYPRFTDDDWNS